MATIDIHTHSKETIVKPGGQIGVVRQKGEAEFSTELADMLVKNTVASTGRCATLAKELSEADAIMELLAHRFKLAHLDVVDETKIWLKDAREFRYAIEGEYRGIAKTMADITAYFNQAEVKAATAQLHALCEVVERVSKLNADPQTQKLIEALLAR